jgi:hypothetical protein
MTRRSLIWLAVLALLMIAFQAVIGWSVLPDSYDAVINYMWIEVPIYTVAVIVTLRDKGDALGTRKAVAFILVVAAILRVMLIPIDPESTDINRYVWDGRVQGAGINPYVHIPADPALKFLRDDDIYPEINRKDYAPTIYPPLAQIVFYLTTRVSEQIWFMKAVMVAFDAITMWALMKLMKARNVPPTRILLYAWHPVPIWQFAADGHVDAVAVACVCLSLLAAEMHRPFLAGIALGGATLTKFFPVLIGPALYRRWDWKLPLAGLLTIALLYLPYLSAGNKLLGFSSGYSAEEGLNNGSGLYPWLLLGHVFAVPQHAFALYWPVAAMILMGCGLACLFRERAYPVDLLGAFLIAATFTALTSPHYIWYMAWLVPFLCFHPSWSVLWLTGAATFMNNISWPEDFVGGSIVFLPFFAIAAGEVLTVWLKIRRTHGNPVVIGSA